MCLTIIAITNNDSRFLVVPLLRKDMIVGTDPTQVALMDKVIIQCAFLPLNRGGTELYFYCCNNALLLMVNNVFSVYTLLYKQ